MASFYPCVKNHASGYTFYISLVSQANTKTMQASPTLAAGDFKIAIDDGAPANLGTLPVVDADYTKRVKVVLSQAETNGDNLTIICSDAAGAEWCDLTINIQTVPYRFDNLDAAISSRMETYTQPTGFLAATFPTGTVANTTNITAGTITTVTNLTNAPTAGDLTATMKASVNAEVDAALADINLDHLVGTATGIPAVPAGTYIDQIMDDGTAVFDRTTDSLQAIRDNMSAGSGDWTATEKENIRHALGVDGTKTAPTAGYGRIGDTTALTDLSTGLGAVKAKTDNLPTDPADQSLLEAAIAGVQADTDNIQTRLPAALVGGRMDSSVGAMAGDTLTAAALAADAVAEIAAGILVTPANKLATDANGYVTEASVDGIKKNTALNNFEFLMVDSTDHVTAKTGLTVTAERSIDGGIFGACANAVAEVGSGIYKINLANTDLNGDVITFKFTATGADARFVTIKTNE